MQMLGECWHTEDVYQEHGDQLVCEIRRDEWPSRQRQYRRQGDVLQIHLGPSETSHQQSLHNNHNTWSNEDSHLLLLKSISVNKTVNSLNLFRKTLELKGWNRVAIGQIGATLFSDISF